MANNVTAANQEIATLEAQRRQLEAQKNNRNTPPSALAQIQATLNSINNRIASARGIINAAVNAASMVNTATGGAVTNAIASKVDQFLERYGNYSGEIARSGRFSYPVPVMTGVNIVGSFEAKLSGRLASSRSGATITSVATLNATASAEIGVQLGYNVPHIGNISITGGIQGNATLEGRAELQLAASGEGLSATLKPASLDLKMSASVFLDMPSVVPDRVLSYIPRYVSGTSLSGKRVTYPLGTVTVLKVDTPQCALTFSLATGRFAGSVSGRPNVYVHPVVVQKFQTLKRGFISAVNEYLPNMLAISNV